MDVKEVKRILDIKLTDPLETAKKLLPYLEKRQSLVKKYYHNPDDEKILPEIEHLEHEIGTVLNLKVIGEPIKINFDLVEEFKPKF